VIELVSRGKLRRLTKMPGRGSTFFKFEQSYHPLALNRRESRRAIAGGVDAVSRSFSDRATLFPR
jgi:hypothetical protein